MVQLYPRYVGQLNHMTKFIPILGRPLVHPHAIHHYPTADVRAETDKFMLIDIDAICAPFYVPFEAKKVQYVADPVRPARQLPDKLPPSMLVIYQYPAFRYRVDPSPLTRSDNKFALGLVWYVGTQDSRSYQEHHQPTQYHGPCLTL